MRAGLASYFDLGSSYGVTDRVFADNRLNSPTSTSMVGISNPLERGVTQDLVADAPAVVEAWRREAHAQLDRPELEPGWQPDWSDLPRERFDAQVREVITDHPVSCLLTLYALGIGYLRFEVTETMDPRLVDGVLTCYEYAAYRPACRMNRAASASSGVNLHPPVGADMVDFDAALGEQFLDVAVRDAVTQVLAHRHHNHLSREPEPRERRSRR